MKIDLYNHVMPVRYLEMMKNHSKDAGIIKRMSGLRMLWDIEARVGMLNQWPDVRQVLTLSLPSPELVGGPELSPQLARIANDDMAAMCAKWPEKFPAFARKFALGDAPRPPSGATRPSARQDVSVAQKFTAETLRKAETALAQHIGAIARIVVKRAAAKARD